MSLFSKSSSLEVGNAQTSNNNHSGLQHVRKSYTEAEIRDICPLINDRATGWSIDSSRWLEESWDTVSDPRRLELYRSIAA